MNKKICVIGAGIAGLTLARRLTEAGQSVVVLDKGRGVGGRASTRRGEVASFDHGAQYFTARDPGFRAFLDQYVPAASWAVWPGPFLSFEGGRLLPEARDEARLVGVPGMSAIARSMASGLDVRVESKVVELAGAPGDWTLVAADGSKFGPFERVVATAPPSQSAALFAGKSPIAEEAGRVAMRPCFTLMIVPREGVTLPAHGVRSDHPVLGWAAIDRSKPGRSGPIGLVIQSNNEWAEVHVNDDFGSVARDLKQAAAEVFGVDLGSTAFESVHRWLYAKPVEPLGRSFLMDLEAGLAITGDWCLAGKVEGAYLSGNACAEALLRGPG